MEIVKSLKECGLLMKIVSETIENEAKKTTREISWHIILYIRY